MKKKNLYILLFVVVIFAISFFLYKHFSISNQSPKSVKNIPANLKRQRLLNTKSLKSSGAVCIKTFARKRFYIL